jgi:hypothetical protein
VILDEEYMMELLKESKKKGRKEMEEIKEINEDVEEIEEIDEDDISFNFKLDKPDECYKIANKQEIKII